MKTEIQKRAQSFTDEQVIQVYQMELDNSTEQQKIAAEVKIALINARQRLMESILRYDYEPPEDFKLGTE